jgi:hypothetical protein
MQNVVYGPIDCQRLGNIVLDEGKTAKPPQALDVLGGAGDQIIDTDNIMPEPDEALAEVGANETSASGDQSPCHDKIESDPATSLTRESGFRLSPSLV